MADTQQQQQASYNAEPDALRNLIVNYIPTNVDEEQLRQLFERYGAIESVKIVVDRNTQQSRGFGFVKYQTVASTQHAISELNGFTVGEKRLKVALAMDGDSRPRRRNYNNYNRHNNNNNNNNQHQNQNQMQMQMPNQMQNQGGMYAAPNGEYRDARFAWQGMQGAMPQAIRPVQPQ